MHNRAKEGHAGMLRFRLRQLISEFEFREQRHLSLAELAAATGISRPTLSRIAGPKPFNTTTDNLDALCAFFGCRIEQLVEYVPSVQEKPADAV
jgi:putative transcriptional regulator